MNKFIRIVSAAFVLLGLMFALIPATPASAGGCLYPGQVATGAYYVYDHQTEPGMYEMCERLAPGTVPGYMNIDAPFDVCLYPDQAATGEYYVYSVQEQPELYAVCGLYSPGTVPGYSVKNQFERLGRPTAK